MVHKIEKLLYYIEDNIYLRLLLIFLVGGASILLVRFGRWYIQEIPVAIHEQFFTYKLPPPPTAEELAKIKLPPIPTGEVTGIRRISNLHTDSSRYLAMASNYLVRDEDTVSSIAVQYGLSPITILYNNQSALMNNPDNLSAGQFLSIPPANGFFYEWRMEDTVEQVAQLHQVNPSDILLWNQQANTEQKTFKGMADMPGQGHFAPGTRVFIPVTPAMQAPTPSQLMASAEYCTQPQAAAYPPTLIFESYPIQLPERLSEFNPADLHFGVDLGSPNAVFAYAMDDGVVIAVGEMTTSGHWYILVQHDDGWVAGYSGLAEANVTCGQDVSRVTTLGKFDGSYSKIHLELFHPTLGMVDPTQFVSAK